MSEQERFIQEMKSKFGDLVDLRICLNGDGGFMAWDARVAFWAWQAAIPKGFVLMPEKLSIEQVNGLYYSGHAWGDIDETKEYFEDVYDTLISSRGI